MTLLTSITNRSPSGNKMSPMYELDFSFLPKWNSIDFEKVLSTGIKRIGSMSNTVDNQILAYHK